MIVHEINNSNDNYAANFDLIIMKNFFTDEFFDWLVGYHYKLFNGANDNVTFKRNDHKVTVNDILCNSNYSSILRCIIKTSQKSYVNLSNKKPRKELWHFDHSQFTLVLPIIANNTSLGTKFVNKRFPILLSSFVHRLRLCNLLASLFDEYNTHCIPNTGYLMKGRELLHTTPPITDDSASRVVLIAHF